MKHLSLILLLIIFSSCNVAKQNDNTPEWDYLEDFKTLGNTKIDTTIIRNVLTDVIDDTITFKKVKFDFVSKENKIYKKAKTHRSKDDLFITIEYYQDFSDRIDIESYRDIGDRFFTTNNEVYFWWVNSDGNLMINVSDADAKTFKPFEDICGGTDTKGVYYGSPNFGVSKLNIPIHSNFEFIPKKNNYWNAPEHYVIIDNKVYDIKYDLDKGYFCELEKGISPNEIKQNL